MTRSPRYSYKRISTSIVDLSLSFFAVPIDRKQKTKVINSGKENNRFSLLFLNCVCAHAIPLRKDLHEQVLDCVYRSETRYSLEHCELSLRFCL